VFVWIPSGSLILEEEGMYHMNERWKERQRKLQAAYNSGDNTWQEFMIYDLGRNNL
jgi:hypothetical protein